MSDSGGKASVLAVAGTRPEVIKLAPLVVAARRGPIDVRLGLSGQHGRVTRAGARELGLTPVFDLPESARALDLSRSLARLLEQLDGAFAGRRPHGVLVQGDTTTSLAASIAAFHRSIPVFHVEAGLRTESPDRPFPEEMNRRLVTRLAALHFAPTEGARANLLREGVAEATVLVTGNTVVDALEIFGGRGAPSAEALLGDVPPERPKLLVTLHRRENEAPAPGIAAAVQELAETGAVEVFWLRHPNATSRAALGELKPPVRVLDPLPYAAFIALLSQMHVVLTDSGGVQEEAPALGVPVLVLRRETDRPEAVLAGNAVVTGDHPSAIIQACKDLLDDAALHAGRRRVIRPFGDGKAAPRILAALERYFFA